MAAKLTVDQVDDVLLIQEGAREAPVGNSDPGQNCACC